MIIGGSGITDGPDQMGNHTKMIGKIKPRLNKKMVT